MKLYGSGDLTFQPTARKFMTCQVKTNGKYDVVMRILLQDTSDIHWPYLQAHWNKKIFHLIAGNHISLRYNKSDSALTSVSLEFFHLLVWHLVICMHVCMVVCVCRHWYSQCVQHVQVDFLWINPDVGQVVKMDWKNFNKKDSFHYYNLSVGFKHYRNWNYLPCWPNCQLLPFLLSLQLCKIISKVELISYTVPFKNRKSISPAFQRLWNAAFVIGKKKTNEKNMVLTLWKNLKMEKKLYCMWLEAISNCFMIFGIDCAGKQRLYPIFKLLDTELYPIFHRIDIYGYLF